MCMFVCACVSMCVLVCAHSTRPCVFACEWLMRPPVHVWVSPRVSPLHACARVSLCEQRGVLRSCVCVEPALTPGPPHACGRLAVASE